MDVIIGILIAMATSVIFAIIVAVARFTFDRQMKRLGAEGARSMTEYLDQAAKKQAERHSDRL